MNPLAQCVDHVVVPVDDPAALFGVIAGDLGIPVAWPLTSYGIFDSAGVTFGNCGMEILRDTGSGVAFFESRLPVVVRGIALKPSAGLEETAAALDARNVAHSGVVPFGRRRDGGPIGHILSVDDAVGKECMVYFIEFPGSDVMCGPPAASMLAASAGGAIGVQRLAEIQIGVSDLAIAAERWQSILDPIPQEQPGLWRIGDGPAIRLKDSPIEGVAGLVVQVGSLDQARAALAERRLLGPVRAHGCGLRHPDTHGLDIWLVQ